MLTHFTCDYIFLNKCFKNQIFITLTIDALSGMKRTPSMYRSKGSVLEVGFGLWEAARGLCSTQGLRSSSRSGLGVGCCAVAGLGVGLATSTAADFLGEML